MKKRQMLFIVFGILIVVAILVGVALELFGKITPKPVPRSQSTVLPEAQAPIISRDTFFVYSTYRIIDFGKPDWNNDDVKEYTVAKRSLTTGQETILTSFRLRQDQGGPVFERYGKDVLIHRYGDEQTDAILSLDGTLKTRPVDFNGWIRSKNSQHELHYVNDGEEDSTKTYLGLLSLDGQSFAPTKRFFLKDFSLSANEFPQIVFLTDDGSRVFIRSVPNGDMPYIPRFFWMTLQTGKIEEVLYRKDLSITQTQDVEVEAFPGAGKIIVALSETKPCGDGETCGLSDEKTEPPSKIYEVDMLTHKTQLVLEDRIFVLTPWFVLDPQNRRMAYKIDPSSIWIGEPLAPRRNEDLKTNGRLLDWLKDGIVVERENSEIAYMNFETRQFMTLTRSRGYYTDADYQVGEYIGSFEKP